MQHEAIGATKVTALSNARRISSTKERGISAMEELFNKLVIAELGTYGHIESIKGTVIALMDDWLKIETK